MPRSVPGRGRSWTGAQALAAPTRSHQGRTAGCRPAWCWLHTHELPLHFSLSRSALQPESSQDPATAQPGWDSRQHVVTVPTSRLHTDIAALDHEVIYCLQHSVSNSACRRGAAEFPGLGSGNEPCQIRGHFSPASAARVPWLTLLSHNGPRLPAACTMACQQISLLPQQHPS